MTDFFGISTFRHNDVERQQALELRRQRQQRELELARQGAAARNPSRYAPAANGFGENLQSPRRVGQIVPTMDVAGRELEGMVGDQDAAAREAELRRRCIRVGLGVVAALVTLAGIVLLILFETGSGKPNRGGPFRGRAADLRNAGSDTLDGACPTCASWSGEAAEGYDGMVRGQQARLEAMAEADLQVADALATQADHVEHARQVLTATHGVLDVGIEVATLLEGQWLTALAAASPAAPVFEEVLVAFGAGVALTAITAGVGALTAMDDAGKQTQETLTNVMGTYKWVTDEAVARSVSWSSTDGVPTAAMSTSSSFPDVSLFDMAHDSLGSLKGLVLSG